MARLLTTVTTLFAVGLFAWAVPLTRFFSAIQPLIVALSIMVAAVFVRLNRGMPTLEWKSLDPKRRKELTSSIVTVTEEYAWIIGINAIALIGLVSLTAIGAKEVGLWPDALRRVGAGIVGGLVSLCAARMAYVVWRDIDVVRLQKRLIDAAADKESLELEIAAADEKVMEFKSANIRRVAVQPPKAWVE